MASAAGVASAFVSAPAELVMIQQQKHGRPLLKELQHIVKQHGLKQLYRGMVRAPPQNKLHMPFCLPVDSVISQAFFSVSGFSKNGNGVQQEWK